MRGRLVAQPSAPDQYIDLGKVAPIQYTPAINDRSEWKDTFHTVKLGINYHFNAPSPVVSAKY